MQILSYAGGGYEGELVRVEVDLRRGIPGLDIVGLPDSAVRESRERVRAAIRNSGFHMPRERILINLAPAGVKKMGTAFDLSIAAAILFRAGQLPEEPAEKLLIVGELGLSGQVRGVPGVLAAAVSARAEEAVFFIVPEENRDEARAIGGGGVLGVAHLDQLPHIFAMLLHGRYRSPDLEPPDLSGDLSPEHEHHRRSRPLSPAPPVSRDLDFADMEGQVKLKRACEIAAAGRHHLLLFGPPGAGKTMAAFRLPGLLPPLSENESIEVSRIYSIGGKLAKGFGLIREAPFRVPHHSASREGIVGGGPGVLPGEISYAHNGVLFLDETMQFSAGLLQSLREPIEHGTVQIARSGYHYWFPARFQLILAMNPCPCGKLGQAGASCMCSPLELHKYWKKLGAAFLDRIDIRVPVEPLYTEPAGETAFPEGPGSEFLLPPEWESRSSPDMQQRVLAAVEIQRERFRSRENEEGSMRNAEMGPGELRDFCVLDSEAGKILSTGITELGLSFRAEHSVLKIARTIADLGGIESIRSDHILEALYLRRFGDGDYFWKNI